MKNSDSGSDVGNRNLSRELLVKTGKKKKKKKFLCKVSPIYSHLRKKKIFPRT